MHLAHGRDSIVADDCIACVAAISRTAVGGRIAPAAACRVLCCIAEAIQATQI
jgi:hypothetical protein